MTATPGRLEPLEPLAGIEQEGRRRPHQDLVGMVVEGDDRRPGAARRGFGHEMLEQVRVPEMHPVEDADDDEDRAELRAKLVDALDDVHRGLSRRGWPAIRPGRRRPCRARAARPSPRRSRRGRRPDRAGGSALRACGRPPAGRTNWPRAIAATSSVVSVTTGNASRPRSIGRRSGRRPAGPSIAAARISSSGVASARVNGPDAVRVRAPR